MTLRQHASVPLADPQFPPAFTGHPVAAGHDPFGAAVQAAMTGTHGAGDLFWSCDTDRAAAAIVLEPDVALSQAAQMLPLLMVAIADALGGIGPPNLALTFRWPGTILANGAVIGGVRLHACGARDPASIRERLVAGFALTIAASRNGPAEPGHDLAATALMEEGCGEMDRTLIIEAVARHFLSWIDDWTHDGFGSAHQSWTARTDARGEPVEIVLGDTIHRGTMIGLDESGGALLTIGEHTMLLPLTDAVTGADA
ncbi:biotin/lipoate--protein ligase family protein [Aurantimonas sp. A2-1-M11]|uniref:biotin/lipoate--protein ligase family protein n=1 Tax=Aurantimonas sp. A2-1-M11 TaxID=3113712 RepID=UPI002F921B27